MDTGHNKYLSVVYETWDPTNESRSGCSGTNQALPRNRKIAIILY